MKDGLFGQQTAVLASLEGNLTYDIVIAFGPQFLKLIVPDAGMWRNMQIKYGYSRLSQTQGLPTSFIFQVPKDSTSIKMFQYWSQPKCKVGRLYEF